MLEKSVVGKWADCWTDYRGGSILVAGRSVNSDGEADGNMELRIVDKHDGEVRTTLLTGLTFTEEVKFLRCNKDFSILALVHKKSVVFCHLSGDVVKSSFTTSSKWGDTHVSIFEWAPYSPNVAVALNERNSGGQEYHLVIVDMLNQEAKKEKLEGNYSSITSLRWGDGDDIWLRYSLTITIVGGGSSDSQMFSPCVPSGFRFGPSVYVPMAASLTKERWEKVEAMFDKRGRWWTLKRQDEKRKGVVGYMGEKITIKSDVADVMWLGRKLVTVSGSAIEVIEYPAIEYGCGSSVADRLAFSKDKRAIGVHTVVAKLPLNNLVLHGKKGENRRWEMWKANGNVYVNVIGSDELDRRLVRIQGDNLDKSAVLDGEESCVFGDFGRKDDENRELEVKREKDGTAMMITMTGYGIDADTDRRKKQCKKWGKNVDGLFDRWRKSMRLTSQGDVGSKARQYKSEDGWLRGLEEKLAEQRRYVEECLSQEKNEDMRKYVEEEMNK